MTAAMRTVVIIPARYASRRLPAKPLADIAGRPMIQHVYERAAQASTVHEVIVATDDARIAHAVRAFGGTALITPATLHSGTDRVAFAARSRPDAAIIVNVQGDEPLLMPTMIDEAVAPLIADEGILVGTLVKKIETHDELMNPSVVKVVLNAKGCCMYFSRSVVPFVRDYVSGQWLAQHVFYKHIGIYVFRREFLATYAGLPQGPLEIAEKLEQLRILEHGYAIRAAVTSYDSIPVDTQEDLEKVRSLVGAQS